MSSTDNKSEAVFHFNDVLNFRIVELKLSGESYPEKHLERIQSTVWHIMCREVRLQYQEIPPYFREDGEESVWDAIENMARNNPLFQLIGKKAENALVRLGHDRHAVKPIVAKWLAVSAEHAFDALKDPSMGPLRYVRAYFGNTEIYKPTGYELD